jgi:hypothetical protein
MPKEALPEKLREKRHNDWIFPLSLIPRGWNAFGPRCGKGNPGYLPWPPRIIQGKSVTRWESTGAKSIILIPELEGVRIDSSIYGRTVEAIETNGPERKFKVKLEWRELIWPFSEEDEAMYSPSTIQISPKGWLKMEPSFFVQWDAGDYFCRWGDRPDHLDKYYNRGPYLGRNTE